MKKSLLALSFVLSLLLLVSCVPRESEDEKEAKMAAEQQAQFDEENRKADEALADFNVQDDEVKQSLLGNTYEVHYLVKMRSEGKDVVTEVGIVKTDKGYHIKLSDTDESKNILYIKNAEGRFDMYQMGKNNVYEKTVFPSIEESELSGTRMCEPYLTIHTQFTDLLKKTGKAKIVGLDCTVYHADFSSLNMKLSGTYYVAEKSKACLKTEFKGDESLLESPMFANFEVISIKHEGLTLPLYK